MRDSRYMSSSEEFDSHDRRQKKGSDVFEMVDGRCVQKV
jgi:hypothetical protein